VAATSRPAKLLTGLLSGWWRRLTAARARWRRDLANWAARQAAKQVEVQAEIQARFEANGRAACATRAQAMFALAGRLAGMLGGVLAAAAAKGADLPEDRADAMYHMYSGGGVTAQGPALLIRKSLADKVSLSGSYYVDMVSNASIDVVTTASPYRERRVEHAFGVDYAYRDALVTLAATRGREPDYAANGASLDVTQDVFGGLSTISLGFSRGWDKVGEHNTPGFFDSARHYQYRAGLTQILTPRWIASANLEAISDDGYLGSPYRRAFVNSSSVKENDPRTRTSRALKLRAIGDIGSGSSVRAEYRYFWDTWDIHAHTAEAGYSRHYGEQWLADGFVRYYTQRHALFYSDNATDQTVYISRNRQLGTFHDLGLGANLSYTARRVPGRYEIKVNGSYELLHFQYSDFTDIRTGRPYSFNASVVQVFVTATF